MRPSHNRQFDRLPTTKPEPQTLPKVEGLRLLCIKDGRLVMTDIGPEPRKLSILLRPALSDPIPSSVP